MIQEYNKFKLQYRESETSQEEMETVLRGKKLENNLQST